VYVNDGVPPTLARGETIHPLTGQRRHHGAFRVIIGVIFVVDII
jgi:hypothetical protein